MPTKVAVWRGFFYPVFGKSSVWELQRLEIKGGVRRTRKRTEEGSLGQLYLNFGIDNSYGTLMLKMANQYLYLLDLGLYEQWRVNLIGRYDRSGGCIYKSVLDRSEWDTPCCRSEF